MTDISTSGRAAFRDYVTDGVPSSGIHSPVKSDIRALFDDIDDAVSGSPDAFTVGAGNVNAQTGTTYTLLNSDNGKVVTLSNASAITLTVPAGLVAGFCCTLVQLGAGTVTVTASGTTLRSRGGLALGGQYAQAGLFYIAANTYAVGGDVT